MKGLPAQFGVWSGSQKSPNIVAGVWQNIIMTFDGNELKSYINGNLSTNNSREVKNTDMNIYESKLFLGGIGVNSNYKGEIDELRIYNRELSAKEVKAIYDLDK
ncbi:MAG: LamG domain-containing protein [Candidatus Gracilibacteria bacterium]|nr:LamG domain-containing protein [Candidatus Gracilibacteria bacterium]